MGKFNKGNGLEGSKMHLNVIKEGGKVVLAVDREDGEAPVPVQGAEVVAFSPSPGGNEMIVRFHGPEEQSPDGD